MLNQAHEALAGVQGIGLSGFRYQGSAAFTAWCLSFLNTLFRLCSRLVSAVGLDESIFFLAVLVLGVLLLGWGCKYIYRVLFFGFTTCLVTLGALATDFEPVGVAGGLLAGLYGGWYLVVWYRKQVLMINALLGFILGGVMGFGIPSALRSALELCNCFEATKWVDESYHSAKANLHYFSFTDAYMCFSGGVSYCDALTVEDCIFISVMVIVGLRIGC